MNVVWTEKDQNESLELLYEKLTCMKNKLYSKGEMIKSFIHTQTVILDAVTKQQSPQNIVHYMFSLVKTSSPIAVPSPAQIENKVNQLTTWQIHRIGNNSMIKSNCSKNKFV